MSNPRGSIYPHAPLRLVTIEVRFGYQPRFNQRAARDDFAQRISSGLPLLSEEVIPAPPGQAPEAEGRTQLRATADNRSTSVSLSSYSMDLIASGEHYEGFDQLAPLLRESFEACTSVAPETRVQRVGVRYLNELRLPVAAGTDSWREWVTEPVLGGALALPNPTAVFSQVAFEPAEDQGLVARYGQVSGESIISDEIPLRLPTVTPGDYFMLDIDSWWQGESPRVFDGGEFESLVRTLHAPIETFFEWSITDAARRSFRGEQ